MPLGKDKALPIVLGMFLGRKCQPVASGAAWGQTGTGICQEEPEPDGGMGSILSLSLGGSGMKLLHPGNALLLPRLFSIPG